MFRFVVVAAAVVTLSGCTTILGDYDVASPEDDAGQDGSVTVADGGKDGPSQHVDASTPDGAAHDAAPDVVTADASDGAVTCAVSEKICNGKCVSLTDPKFGCANVASCSPCAYPHATAKCDQGACAFDTCETGYGDCANGVSDGCETATGSDSTHCGSCTKSCSATGGTPNCAGGVCSSVVCSAPNADCDQDPTDGCEIDTSTSAAHCGGCGHACGTANGTPSCNGSACKFACTAPFAHCTNVDSDGCNVDTTGDPNNCGACAHVCGATNGTPSCTPGGCKFACTAPFAHCSGVDSDGCEANTNDDNNNCGVCGTKCGSGQRCSSGRCVCDSTSCAAGCCSGTTCLAGNTTASCGTSGNACLTCSATTANGCGGGACQCNGAAACAAGKTCCGTSGCVDFTTNAKNCGSCGHDCQGGTCVNSTCQPFALASGRTGPLDLAIDTNNVYWTENTIGGVYKVSKNGGAVGTLKTADNVSGSTWFITTDGTSVYWTDRTDGYIGYVGVNGGAFARLANDTAAAQPYGITHDASFVYWTQFAGGGAGGIWRTPIAGGHPSAGTQLGSATGPISVAVTSANTYWVEYAGLAYRGGLTASTAAGTPLTSTSNPSNNVDTRFVTTDGTRVYWTMSDGGSVWTVPVGGGTAQAISTVEAEPWGIAVDASGVYWVNKNPSGAQAYTVRRARLVGSAWSVVTIASGQAGASSIALDATAAYWTNFAGNQIMKIVK